MVYLLYSFSISYNQQLFTIHFFFFHLFSFFMTFLLTKSPSPFNVIIYPTRFVGTTETRRNCFRFLSLYVYTHFTQEYFPLLVMFSGFQYRTDDTSSTSFVRSGRPSSLFPFSTPMCHYRRSGASWTIL